jgi:Plasmid pRiA4b ORF-3-like protein
VLQAAFNWHDRHLHRFELPGRDRHETPLELGSESTRRLYQLLVEPGDQLDYTYDFGDDWAHRIVLEKVEPADGVRHAVCVAGRRAAPPEDSGGRYGYESLCAARPLRPMSSFVDERHEYVPWKRWFRRSRRVSPVASCSAAPSRPDSPR